MMKEVKIRIPELLIVLIFLINTNFLYLVKGIADDVKLILVIIFILYSYIITIKEKKRKKSLLGRLILFMPVLIITSAIAAYKSYGQSIWLGMRPQRVQLVWWLSYFGTYRLVMYGKIKEERLEKIIYILGILELLAYSTFWILKGNIPFMSLPYDYRYGAIRLRADTMVIIILYMIAMNNVLIGKNSKKNVVLIIIIFIFEVCCAQTRLIMLAMLLAIIALFVIWKKSLAIKLCLIPGIIIAILLLMQTNMGKDVAENIIYGNKDQNLDIRDSGKEFYLEELKKSPIIGRGYVNTQYERATAMAGIDIGYYVVDNGIIGFMWIYGVLGGIWIIWIYVKVIRESFKLYKQEKSYIGIILCVMILILAPNIICWWWNDSFIFGMMILISCMEKNIERRALNEEDKYNWSI